MKKIILSAFVAVGLSGTVMAGGDIAPVTQATADSWSGFYVGLQAGGVWGDADINEATNGNPTGYTNDLSPDGFAGGLYVGYNWLLSDNWLVGIEGDWNYLSGDNTGDFNFYNGSPSSGWAQSVENNWDASLRLRVGKVVDRFMPYITGGIAWANVQDRLDNDTSTPQYHYSEDTTLRGWTMGAGIEYEINTNLKTRLQYRYSDYGDDTVRFYNGSSYADSKVSYKSHIVQVGFSYRF